MEGRIRLERLKSSKLLRTTKNSKVFEAITADS